MGATCLGCGCACDDIDVVVEANRIVEARNACPLGVSWFGDGVVPMRSRVGGRDVALAEALDAAASLLAGSARPLVYVAPDLSCEAQREAVGLADLLRATLDSVTSSTAIMSLLAAQERGRASATLGEIRNRADLVVFWGVDPAVRYPRYATRYAPEPAGVHVPDGRRSRTVVAVDVGNARGPADADHRFSVGLHEEVAVLTMTQADAHPLASILAAGRYVAIVADAEPDPDQPERDSGRAAALIGLAQALNGRTRCALVTMRAGGNRSGADTCLTWQTGYPAAVDFMRGYPRYRPHDGAAARLARGDIDAALVIGAVRALPDDVVELFGRTRCAVIGPSASDGPLAGADVIVDTGVAGIHAAGTALRMDDVPLPLAAPISGAPSALAAIRALRARMGMTRAVV